MDPRNTLEPSPVHLGSLSGGGGDTRGANSDLRQPNIGLQSEISTVDRCAVRYTA